MEEAMKKLIPLMAILVLLLCAFSEISHAQAMTASPTNQKFYYTYSVAVDSPFVASHIDTLPSPSATATTIKIGGASTISATIAVTDTAAADVYVDYRTVGTTTWTVGVTDSIIVAATSGKDQYVIRNNATEGILGLDTEIRIRVAFRASACGVAGTHRYTAKLLWKP
jgi:hypothetical protein